MPSACCRLTLPPQSSKRLAISAVRYQYYRQKRKAFRGRVAYDVGGAGFFHGPSLQVSPNQTMTYDALLDDDEVGNGFIPATAPRRGRFPARSVAQALLRLSCRRR